MTMEIQQVQHATPDATAGPATDSQRRVALMGAGGIAEVHAAALKQTACGILQAIIDPEAGRAERLAERFGAAHALTGTDTLLDGSLGVTAAHVLVPPPMHRRVAEPLLAQGIDVLLEKPLATSEEDCAALIETATASGARLAVNHNFVRHPAFAALLDGVAANRIGPLRHVALTYRMPLRQLAARQFGHFMFDSSCKLLLEQAVHPLSQLIALVDSPELVWVTSGPKRLLDGHLPFVDAWSLGLKSDAIPVEAHLAVGVTQPEWRVIVEGDDGRVEGDILANRIQWSTPTRWIQSADQALRGCSEGCQVIGQAIANLGRYGVAVTGITGRNDPFFRSMAANITAFHAGRTVQSAATSSTGGRTAVALCEAIDKAALTRAVSPASDRPSQGPEAWDVVLLGGTGLIGRHLTAALIARGYRVAVVARSTDRLPPVFQDARVTVLEGSVLDETLLARAFAGRPDVVNLAPGGGSGREGIARTMTDSALTVVNAAAAAGISHVVHVSSIAALDLSSAKTTVTGASQPDPRPERRGDYARAKALTERALRCREPGDGIPVSIVRPGVVVSAEADPFHSGVGFFNTETHCIGWNRGTNPLPLVLAADVGEAIAALLGTPDARGRTYNLVGDVRLSARAYIERLAAARQRPLRFHPATALGWQANEWAKWLVKRASGRRDAMPHLRDFRSRGLHAAFNTRDVKGDLGWEPESDTERFVARAFGHCDGADQPHREAAA